jgi:DNA-binding beta-propeller fold protein YncE
LRAFNEADSEDFFGRESLVQQLLARLSEGGDLSRFLAVVGPSGSGKSSVVGAGLVPALRRGGLPGSENWFIVNLMPGPHPFEELEAALLRIAVNPPESLLAQLKDSNRGLLRAARRILPADESVELVLVIDQFEETFTLVANEEERALLLSSLVAAVLDERSRVRVVITLRADFTDRPLRYVDFGELVQKRSEFVLPLTPDELERAIVGPARRAGLNLESGLTSRMIRDVGDQPGALPLLQYALTELFEKREGRTLTKEAYADIGGVLGALGRRAEEVHASLKNEEQALARQMFLRLVTLGEGVEDTRRRILRSEIESMTNNPLPITNAIESFGKSRLLSFDRDPITRGPTVEVAHEALLREWPRLREWLNESRADVRLQRQLATAASEWQSANRDVSYLLSGMRLAQFEGWAATSAVALTHEERAYLDTSIAEREKQAEAEQARQRRELEAARKLAETERQSAVRLRTRNRVITAVGVLAILAAIVAAMFGRQANANFQLANQNLSAAQIANTQSAANAATAQAASTLAFDNASAAESARDEAFNAEATAEAERLRAESEKQLAISRELALASLNNLDVDPERSVLLALHGLSQAHTSEAEEALHRAVQALRVQFTLRGHTEPVGGVAYSPDGMRLATASEDGSVKIWDTATGQELLTLKAAPDGFATDVTFSPDGARLAAAVGDGLVQVWDVNTRQKLLDFSGHTAFIFEIVFSPDGARLATASDDGTAKVWDAASGKEMFTLSGHTLWVGSIVFSRDGTRLATISGDGTAKIWDAATGREMLSLNDGLNLYDVAFSPDGERIATVNREGVVKVWDAASGQVLLTLTGHTNLIFSVAYGPDGTQFATAGADSTIKVWDAASGQELLTLGGHTGFILDLAYSPDGAHLASVSEDGAAKTWDVSPAGSRELLTMVGARFRNVNFSPDE